MLHCIKKCTDEEKVKGNLEMLHGQFQFKKMKQSFHYFMEEVLMVPQSYL